MKLQSIRLVSLAALVLMSPLLTLAAGQPKLHASTSIEGHQSANATRNGTDSAFSK